MKLSILIPAYNCENYIGNCLESLVNQDLPNSDYEILVINDGSKDNTKQVIEQFASKHSNILFHDQINMGVFKTRNNLLKMAKGQYIFNIDADDYIVANSLKALFEIASQNNVDFLGFGSTTTDKKNLIGSGRLKKDLDVKKISGIEFISQNSSLKITVWWYLVNSAFLKDNNLLFEEGNPLADGPFTLKVLLKAQHVAYVPLDIYRHLIVPSSITHNINHSHLRKMVTYYVDVIYRYDQLASHLSDKSNTRQSNSVYLVDATKKIYHWRDVNLFVMFYTFIKSNIQISEIDKVLVDLQRNNIYPIKYFIGDRHNSLKHRLLTNLFNNKYFFYTLLYPFRLLHRLRIIKFS